MYKILQQCIKTCNITIPQTLMGSDKQVKTNQWIYISVWYNAYSMGLCDVRSRDKVAGGWASISVRHQLPVLLKLSAASVNHSQWCCCFGLGTFQHLFFFFAFLTSVAEYLLVYFLLFFSPLGCELLHITPKVWCLFPQRPPLFPPKLLPSWAIYSFGYLSVIAPLWSLREANHLLWPQGRNGHQASDPLQVGERRRDCERPAPIQRRNNTARAAQFHLSFHPIIWKLFINNSFLSHTRAPGEGRRGGRDVGTKGEVWEDVGSGVGGRGWG